MSIRELLVGTRQVLGMHLARLKYAYASILVLLVAASFWIVFLPPPARFPSGTVITIAPGLSIRSAASQLRRDDAIISSFAFRVLVRAIAGNHGVQSGAYVFPHPVGLLTVAWNLSHGISGIPRIRITFPEGTTVHQMGRLLAADIPNFSADRFYTLAGGEEGQLFPDTYFFLPDTTEAGALAIMHANYTAHIARFERAIASSGRSEHDILVMASLLEGEGKTMDDKRMIAGILWHRIELHMPLQVDAPFAYIHQSPGYTPTALDLASASPYNTYRHAGLPPTPINNPGDDSILAALTPTKSPYLYYLSGTDGQIHYAVTLAGHIANQKKYLK